MASKKRKEALSIKEKENILVPMLLLTPWGSIAHACPEGWLTVLAPGPLCGLGPPRKCLKGIWILQLSQRGHVQT